MKYYIATNGEIIAPVQNDAGAWVPIEERYTAEFVSTLREYDPDTEPNPPERAPPVQLPATPEQLGAQRDALLTFAGLRIAPLQDASDLEEATTAEIALLKKWKQYRVALNRLDLTAQSLEWPAVPEA